MTTSRRPCQRRPLQLRARRGLERDATLVDGQRNEKNVQHCCSASMRRASSARSTSRPNLMRSRPSAVAERSLAEPRAACQSATRSGIASGCRVQAIGGSVGEDAGSTTGVGDTASSVSAERTFVVAGSVNRRATQPAAAAAEAAKRTRRVGDLRLRCADLLGDQFVESSLHRHERSPSQVASRSVISSREHPSCLARAMNARRSTVSSPYSRYPASVLVVGITSPMPS